MVERVVVVKGMSKGGAVLLTAHDLGRAKELQVSEAAQGAQLYVLASINAVTIEGCGDCTIFLGAVKRHITISCCRNVHLIACTRAIRIMHVPLLSVILYLNS